MKTGYIFNGTQCTCGAAITWLNLQHWYQTQPALNGSQYDQQPITQKSYELIIQIL